MHTSDYCRAQSSEVNELAAQARRDVEIRMLESISETWAILAVQIDQYLAANGEAPASSGVKLTGQE